MKGKLLFFTGTDVNCHFCCTTTKFDGVYASLYQAIIASCAKPFKNFHIFTLHVGHSFATNELAFTCIRTKVLSEDISLQPLVGENCTPFGSLSYTIKLGKEGGLFLCSPYCRSTSQYKVQIDNVTYYLEKCFRTPNTVHMSDTNQCYMWCNRFEAFLEIPLDKNIETTMISYGLP